MTEKIQKILMNEPLSMIRKVVQVGDSIGITLSKEDLKFSGIEKGDSIRVWFRKANDIEKGE